LIGIEDLRLAEAKGSIERGQTKAGLQSTRQFPTEHEAAEPVHHGHQIEKAATHRNVRNIGAPDMVRSLDRDTAQQIWIHLMAWGRTTQVRLRVVSLDSQNPHQALHTFAVHA